MGYLIVYGGWFHITICNYVLMKFIARRAYGIVENNVTQTRYLVEVKGCHPRNQIEIVRHILFQHYILYRLE